MAAQYSFIRTVSSRRVLIVSSQSPVRMADFLSIREDIQRYQIDCIIINFPKSFLENCVPFIVQTWRDMVLADGAFMLFTKSMEPGEQVYSLREYMRSLDPQIDQMIYDGDLDTNELPQVKLRSLGSIFDGRYLVDADGKTDLSTAPYWIVSSGILLPGGTDKTPTIKHRAIVSDIPTIPLQVAEFNTDEIDKLAASMIRRLPQLEPYMRGKSNEINNNS